MSHISQRFDLLMMHVVLLRLLLYDTLLLSFVDACQARLSDTKLAVMLCISVLAVLLQRLQQA